MNLRKLKPYLLLLPIFIFIFLFPFKFGFPVAVPEVDIIPLNIIDWIFLPWSPIISSFIIGLLSLFYLLILVRYPFKTNNISYAIQILWFSLFVFSLLGIINSSCKDFAYLECLYISGIAIYCFLIFRLVSLFDKTAVNGLVFTICLSTLIISIFAYYQYFIGFNNTREIILNLANQQGLILNSTFKNKKGKP